MLKLYLKFFFLNLFFVNVLTAQSASFYKDYTAFTRLNIPSKTKNEVVKTKIKGIISKIKNKVVATIPQLKTNTIDSIWHLDSLEQVQPDTFVQNDAVLIELRYFDNNCDQQQQPLARMMQDTVVCYDSIGFKNPSFEGPVGGTITPPNWEACENSPDTMGEVPGWVPPASDGNAYVMIVATHPNFIESLGQELTDTLKAGDNYGFLIDIAHPDSTLGYMCHASVWLGDSLCDNCQQIHSLVVEDFSWKTDTVLFTANQDYTHIYITADYTQPGCGIFIDNIRPLPTSFPCDTFATNTSVVDIQAEAKANSFKLYPNPNHYGTLNIETDIAADMVVIVDALGRQVVAAQYTASATQQLDIQHLPSGFYTVALVKDGQVVAREKLVVQR